MRKTRRGLGVVLASAALVLGCPGDDGSGGSADSGGSGDDGSAGPTSAGPTSAGPTTDATTSMSSTAGPTTGMTGTTDQMTGSSDSGTDTTGNVDCDNLPAAPFAATPFYMGFSGSEDIGFDGEGNLAGKNGGDVDLVDAGGTATNLAGGLGSAYGLRFRSNGDLLVAEFQAGRIMQVTPAGAVSMFMGGVGGVNGLYPDFDDNVWYTNGAQVVRINSDMTTTTIDNLPGSNGVVFDDDRDLLFATNYSGSDIVSYAIDPGTGDPGPATDVVTIAGTALDGLSLDACGNIYAVHQQGNMVYRVFLDAAGAAIGAAEVLLDAATAQNIANAQFGTGAGWTETNLYAAGNPGVVYEIPVGVPGAPIP